MMHDCPFHERFSRFSGFYLYGATPAAGGAIELLRKLGKDILGFVDRDPSKQAQPFMGYSVLSPEQLFSKGMADSAIIIVSAYQMEIYSYLTSQGIVGECIFPHLDDMFFPTYSPYYRNNKTLDRVMAMLTSEKEKKYFKSWRQFKETGDFALLQPLPSMTHQYEHKAWLSSLPSGGVCLDVGAYDGVSSIDLYRSGLFPLVIALEPFKENFQKLKQKIADHDFSFVIEPRQLALGARRQTIWQETEGLSSRAKLTESGGEGINKEKIEVYALDDLALEGLSAIKVDIEGFEPDFLEGAINTLKREKPHIAISAYHHEKHPDYIIEFIEKNVGTPIIHVGHHPQAVYELEYYLSFDKEKRA